MLLTRLGQTIQHEIPLPISIVGTGSSGNAVFIHPFRMLIDLGFTYAKLSESIDLDQVDYIALTHEHYSDHLNLTALKRIVVRHPRVQIILPERLWKIIQTADPEIQQLIQKNVRTFLFDTPFTLNTREGITYDIIPHSTNHGDIINVAYDIQCNQMQTHFLYATDLDTFVEDPSGFPKGLPQDPHNKFNIILLEANYDEEVLHTHINNLTAEIREIDKQITENPFTNLNLQKQKKLCQNELVRAQGNLRHISEAAALEYVKTHLTSEGIFIPMHASREFGTYIFNQ